jgi:hypothetical protein
MEIICQKNGSNILTFIGFGMSFILLNLLINWKEGVIWNWQMAIGCGLLFTGLYNYYQQQNGKKIFFEQLNQILNDPLNIMGEFVLEIDQTKIIMTSPTLSFTQNWTAIHGYVEFENYVFLTMDKYYLDTIGIKKEHINEAEYAEIMSFLKQKFDDNSNPY